MECSEGNTFTYHCKGIQAGYIINPYFNDIELCLAQNKLSCTKAAISKVETEGEKICLTRFNVVEFNNNAWKKETALLSIPETCRDKII